MIIFFGQPRWLLPLSTKDEVPGFKEGRDGFVIEHGDGALENKDKRLCMLHGRGGYSLCVCV